jgi:hypothetical protein
MGFMPELWADKTLEQLLAELQDQQRIVNSVTDYTPFTIGRKANAYNGPKLSGLTVRTLPASAADSPSQSVINIPFDQKKGVVFTVSDIDKAQSSVDMLGALTAQAVTALLDDYDSYILATMIDGLSSTSGYKNTIADTTGHKITKADFIVARRRLNQSKAPRRGRYCAISPEFESDLYDIPDFVSRDKIADTTAMKDGVIGRLLGFDVILANDMPKVTNAWSRTAGTLPVALFYSMHAFGYGRQKEFESKSAPDALVPGDVTNIYSVYGGEVQDDTMLVGFRRDV